ncbi:MAG TPA: sulfotransferase, partial [Mycobacterium sp.]|nr:sulfotransferase [Mycobacterium sp.]
MPVPVMVRAVLGKLGRRVRAAQPSAQATPVKAAEEKKSRSMPPSGPSGYPALAGDRLLERPVFVLSTVRSGSTLLRVMLDTHSAIHAPHETHLSDLRVVFNSRLADEAMAEVGLDEVQLEFLLRDRVLHRELTRHGKRVLVNKTPNDAFRWRRIVECWPDVRFIFLLRHPAAIADSLA